MPHRATTISIHISSGSQAPRGTTHGFLCKRALAHVGTRQHQSNERNYGQLACPVNGVAPVAAHDR